MIDAVNQSIAPATRPGISSGRLAFGGITFLLVVAIAVQTKQANALAMQRDVHQRLLEAISPGGGPVEHSAHVVRVKRSLITTQRRPFAAQPVIALVPTSEGNSATFGLSSQRPVVLMTSLPPPARA